MAWVTIIESDVKGALSNGELESYRNLVANGDTDPLAGIIADVTAEVRGYIVTRYTLPSAAGLPQSLKNAAVDIIVYRLCKRAKTSTEDQRKPAADDARALLERVADGKHGVEDATDATTAAASAGALPSIGERTRYFDRDSQDGA